MSVPLHLRFSPLLLLLILGVGLISLSSAASSTTAPTSTPTPSSDFPPWGTNDVHCARRLPRSHIPEHLQWARMLSDAVIAGTGNSTYRHTAGPIYWGDYSCNSYWTSVSDCNGFLSAILKQAYNLAVPPPAGFDHPYASTYWHAIMNERNGFTRIRHPINWRAGDIIAFNYLYGLNDTEFLGTKNSGHAGVINSAPVIATASAPIIPNTVQWSFGIIDQTSDPHYVTDSRYNRSTGLGTGTMRLYTSTTNGTLVGYAWSFSPVTLFHQQSVVRSIAVGRL